MTKEIIEESVKEILKEFANLPEEEYWDRKIDKDLINNIEIERVTINTDKSGKFIDVDLILPFASFSHCVSYFVERKLYEKHQDCDRFFVYTYGSSS